MDDLPDSPYPAHGARNDPANPEHEAPPTSRLPPPPSTGALVREVADLLADFRLLMRYLVRWRPQAVPLYGVPTGSMDRDQTMLPNELVTLAPGIHMSLLQKTPGEIASDGILLRQLYESLKTLSKQAEPANSASIRLTGAFLDTAMVEAATPEIRTQKRNLGRWILGMGLFGICMFIISVMVLIHVDRGRRSLQQLENVRLEYAQALTALEQMNGASADGANALARCQSVPPPAPTASCRSLQAALRKLTIVRAELQDWNILSDRLSLFVWRQRPLGDSATQSGLSEQQWESSELRTSARMAGLSGVVLPMLLGLLGACTYVYRDLYRQVRTWTLHQTAGVHGTLRIILGVILGGLLGVVWTNNQPIELEGVTLSLAALAFFVGFGVEIVFKVLDVLIVGAAHRIEK